jgi:hypothetical protein
MTTHLMGLRPDRYIPHDYHDKCPTTTRACLFVFLLLNLRSERPELHEGSRSWDPDGDLNLWLLFNTRLFG